MLARYFGKAFVQKHDIVDLRSYQLSAVTHGPGGKNKSQNHALVLILYLSAAKFLSRAGKTLHEVQTHLDKEGASDLVVELVIKSVHSSLIFGEAVELGIALLEGGNPIIQKSMFNKLMGGDLSQSYFKVSIIYCIEKLGYNDIK